jgi:hypothetical protein
MIGQRVNSRTGTWLGSAVGSVSDDEGATSNYLPGVTVDAAADVYCPSTNAEWATVLTAAGLAIVPNSIWTFQEPSGTIADKGTAGLTLTQASSQLYNQLVPGWSRFSVNNVDGTANQRWFNAAAPNPNTTSILILAYVSIPAVSPTVARDLIFASATADIRFNTTGKLRVVFGASADLTVDPRGTVQPIIMKIDNTNSVSACYTLQEKFIGTYVLPTSSAVTAFGGQATAASAAGYLYGAEFIGTNAQLTDNQIRTLYQTLRFNPLW